jgi:hypothetical protein
MEGALKIADTMGLSYLEHMMEKERKTMGSCAPDELDGG